ncbi:MAG: biotin--[acetyl-CoA-carboxylase] ligase [Deltaproteobacteria bacterium]|nr:biotin--[acetyl-CoA-carboxylase] ligase [Deltaproteobacteria bacterium]
MSDDSDVLVRERIEAELRARGIRLGLPLVLVDETGSTNDLASEEAMKDIAHGALILADRQTRGRGRLGRKWFSPGGQNLYMSLVLRPQVPVERLAAITLVIGLGVAEGIAGFVPGVEVGLKWPNDVLIARRKAVGILVEASMSGALVRHVIAGIGVDVLQRSFDPEIASIATSIALHAAQPPDRTTVLVEVLGHLQRRLEQFEREGIDAMLEDLRARDATRGHRVRCVAGEGTGAGIAQDGALRVQLAQGELVTVRAGDVHLL